MLSELRYSLRGLGRNPGLAAALLVTIAVGIGGNAMVSSFIRGSLTHDNALPDADRVVSVFARDATGGLAPLSPTELSRIRDTSSSFAALGALRERQDQVTFGQQLSWVTIGEFTPELLTVLGRKPVDDVIVSHRFWRVALAAPAKFVGQNLMIKGKAVRIGGFMPEEIEGLYASRPIDVWMPMSASDAEDSKSSTARTLWIVGRFRDGATLADAQRELATIGGDGRVQAQAYTGLSPDVSGSLSRVGTLLPVAALLVFLVACANVATFLLARGSSRAHETAVRVAIGADRRHITRQLLSDVGVIATLGAAAGGLCALWASRIVPALFFDQDAEQLGFQPDVVLLVGICVACLLITIICGLTPLLEVRDDEPSAVLRRETGGLSNAARRLRAWLVVAQMAVSCLLLVVTGLLLSGYRLAMQTTVGGRLDEPVVATLTGHSPQLFEAAARAAIETPGVTSISWTSSPPGSRPAWQRLRVEPVPTSMRTVKWSAQAFPPDKSFAIATAPLTGRMFGGLDSSSSCPAVMLNQAAAAVIGGDVVGRLIEDPSGRRVEIVGVAEVTDARTRTPAAPAVYYYEAQAPPPVAPGSVVSFRIPDWDETASTDSVALDVSVVSHEYFTSVGASVTSGHDFNSVAAQSRCGIAMLNAEAAERYLSGAAAGRTLIDEAGRRFDIIGTVKTPPLRGSQRVVEPTVFYPMAQQFLPRMTLIAGTSGDVPTIVRSLTSRLAKVPGQQVEPKVMTLEQYLSRGALSSERITATLIGACALMALVLAMIGEFGAMAESVRQRRRELAVRVALGAPAWRLVMQVLTEGARLAATGAAIGALGAAAADHWLLQTPAEASVLQAWLGAPLVLAVVVLIASVIPARRAVRSDPLSVMKDS